MADKKETTQYHYGTGRRKRAIARVRVHENGTGVITINEKPNKEYFTTDMMVRTVAQPLNQASLLKEVDVTVKVSGGGLVSQSEAVRLGIARALVSWKPDLRTSLKPLGFLKRDPRKKERKKPGLKKARRAPQFSKR